MKNSIAYALGVITISLFSFTAGSNFNTIKPLKPKSTVILTDHRSDNTWKGYVKKGYQIQHIASGDRYYRTLVLVKY